MAHPSRRLELEDGEGGDGKERKGLIGRKVVFGGCNSDKTLPFGGGGGGWSRQNTLLFLRDTGRFCCLLFSEVNEAGVWMVHLQFFGV